MPQQKAGERSQILRHLSIIRRTRGSRNGARFRYRSDTPFGSGFAAGAVLYWRTLGGNRTFPAPNPSRMFDFQSRAGETRESRPRPSPDHDRRWRDRPERSSARAGADQRSLRRALRSDSRSLSGTSRRGARVQCRWRRPSPACDGRRARDRRRRPFARR